MLSEPYKLALQAMKDQAAAATMQLEHHDRSAGKAALTDARRRMALYPAEVKRIYAAVMKSPVESDTIPSLTEARLAQLLGAAI
jgi:hypothetical protein